MSLENKNYDLSDNPEYIDTVLNEARATILGEEVVRQAEAIAHYAGEIAPRAVISVAEDLTHFTGTTLAEAVIEEAEAIPTYDAEVVKTGEHLEDHRSEWEDIPQAMVVTEAEQILTSHNEMEDFIAVADKDATVEGAIETQKAVEERNQTMLKIMNEQVNEGPSS